MHNYLAVTVPRSQNYAVCIILRGQQAPNHKLFVICVHHCDCEGGTTE